MPFFENHPAAFMDCQRSGMYRGICVHVVDGDTFDVLVDLGFLQYRMLTVRLYGADTPELNSPDPQQRDRAKVARDRVRDLMTNQAVLIRTFKDKRSFDRYIADTWLEKPENFVGDSDSEETPPLAGSETTWLSLKTLLLREQLASER